MTPARSECTLATPGHPCPRLRVVAIVLAAGAASRMGGRPKCLLKRDGQTLLQRLLARLEAAGIDETVLVLGHHADAVQRALDSAPDHATVRRMALHRVLNPQPTDGQNSSLHLGLAKAQTLAPDWLMVALADQPLLETQDLQDLVAAVKHAPAGTQMLQPQISALTQTKQVSQPGNPVMLRKAVMADLLHNGQSLGNAGASKLPGGKEWRQRNPSQFHPWPTPNVHYFVDMDTPEDLAALQAQHGIQLAWDEGL